MINNSDDNNKIIKKNNIVIQKNDVCLLLVLIISSDKKTNTTFGVCYTKNNVLSPLIDSLSLFSRRKEGLWRTISTERDYTLTS